MDASNMLKPALARGELRCVGATTLDEYRKHIEKDAALERRFQPVYVGEPTVEDTIAILRGLKERYEVHHGVRIKDSALVAAATLSNRYIADRFLPDKAIDLMDEAASRLRIEIDSMPTEIDEVERKLIQLEIEREALKKETDEASKERLAKLERESGRPEGAVGGMKAHWQQEKDAIQKIRTTKEQIEQTAQSRASTRRGDLAKAAELQYGTLPSSRSSSRPRTRGSASSSEAEDAQGGGRRGGHRRGGGQVDRHPRLAPARGRDAEAPPHGGPPARARRRPGRGAAPSRTPCAAPAPASATRTGRSARSSSWARPASARPSSRGRSPSSCSTTSTRWCASTCPSTWRSTPSPG